MARGVKAGDKAPDFTLPSQSGDQVRLYDRLGQRRLEPAVHEGEAVDEREELHLLLGAELGPGQQPEEVVDVAQRVGPPHRRAVHDRGQPVVPLDEIPALAGQVRDGRPRIGRWRARIDVLGGGLVDHQLDQVVLGGDVVVQRHGADAEFGGDPAHGHRVDALGVGDPDRYLGDGGAAVPGLRPALTMLGQRPDRHLRAGASVRPGCRPGQLRSPPPPTLPAPLY